LLQGKKLGKKNSTGAGQMRHNRNSSRAIKPLDLPHPASRGKMTAFSFLYSQNT
jgi:hypothetical protein